MNPLAWIDEELARLDRAHLRRRLTVRASPQSGEIRLEDRELVNFGSNDYLALAADPKITQAVRDALAEEGWGTGASPLVTGRSRLHARLEEELARFEGTDAALLFPTGFAANAGTIAALAGRGDVVFSDAKNHASIIDGCRLSGAKVAIYRHGDVDHLRELLREQDPDARRKLIATDTLFSMDGDLAPLPDLARLAAEQGAMLLVDEAHATGVFGEHGRGIGELLHVEEEIHIRVGTLSKALGSHGGFVAGSRQLIDYLANRARSYVFSTAAPAALCAAGLAALEFVRSEPTRRHELLARANNLREHLRAAGLNVGNSASQIIPVILGDPTATMAAAARLRDRGLFVPGIRPPTVPEGESLLRISLTWAHTPQQIDRLATELCRE